LRALHRRDQLGRNLRQKLKRLDGLLAQQHGARLDLWLCSSAGSWMRWTLALSTGRSLSKLSTRKRSMPCTIT